MHILENKNFQKTFKTKKIIIQIFLYLKKTKHFLPKKMYLNTKCLSPHRSAGGHATRSGSLHGGSSSSGIHVWRASLPSGITSSVPVIPGRGSARGYPPRGWSSGRRASVGGRTATRLASVWRFVHIVWRTSTVSLRAYIPNNFWGKYFMKHKYCTHGFYANILKANNAFCTFLLASLESGLFK